MTPYIDIRYNIFTEDEINKMLMGFHLNEDKISKYRDTFVLSLKGENYSWYNKKYEPYIHDNVIDWMQIVRWPEGSTQKIHVDDSNNNTTIASITFLNDNFDGGETFFGDGTIVRPLKNKTIFFTGVELIHGLKKVTNGDRYTIATWYKKK